MNAVRLVLASTSFHMAEGSWQKLPASLNNTCTAPVSDPASTLQLPMNLFDFRCVTCSDGEFTGEDDVQHVNECVSRDVCQFSQHGQLRGMNLKFAMCSRNPAARREHDDVDVKRL